MNALATTWMPDHSRAVLVSAPERPAPPEAARLAEVIKQATTAPLTAYVDAVTDRPLLDPLPEPGTIVRTTTRAAAGITEWELSNGVHVVLKPTTFKQDEVLFRAISPGGTSLASDADFVAAETADLVVSDGGLGALSETDLNKRLAGKSVAVQPDIGETTEGLRGGASPRDLDTMFQLVYLTFTQPRADADAFDALTRQLAAGLANRQALPETAFQDAVQAALTQDHPRAPAADAGADRADGPRQVARVLQDRFADASDFTFVFVGSFDLAAMAPLAEQYLASLPALHRHEAARDVGIRAPTGIVERQVVKGIEPKGEVGVVFTGPFQNDQAHRVLMRAMADALEGNLQSTLREKLGGTYGVSVTPEFRTGPVDEYHLSITFGCDPVRIDALVQALFEEIDAFRTDGPGRSQTADIRAAMVRDLETNLRDNGYLVSQMALAQQYGEDVAEVFTLRSVYDALTPAAIREAARQYLDEHRYVKVTLRPERGAGWTVVRLPIGGR